MSEIHAEIQEQTPIIQLPFTIENPIELTYEDRQKAYDVIRQFSDYHLLPLPEEFWDNDPFSDRGLEQLDHDAHIVALLNKNMIEMSPAKEAIVRKRLAHKIELIRESSRISHRANAVVESTESLN
jgi:hypothetical protein